MNEAASPFWQFSLATYRHPEIAQACLTLQDRWNVDVNVLLFLLWCGSEHRRVPIQDIRELIDLTGPWNREVVQTLRAARRSLKAPPAHTDAQATATLRGRVKADELEAERLQQEMMFSALPLSRFERSDERFTTAISNISAYGGCLGRPFPEQLVHSLCSVLK